MDICYIVGAGEFKTGFSMDQGDYIIAADGGYDHLRKMGIEPDVVIGDFDSIAALPERDLIRYPVMKDDTDMMLCVKEGLNKGYRRFLIYGGLGGRLDHTFANIQTLAYLAAQGARGMLMGEQDVITLIQDESIVLSPTFTGRLSVFAYGGAAEGVTLKGLLYQLENGRLEPTFPLGVSNEFIGKEAIISVEKGALLLMWQRKEENVFSFT